MTGAVFLLEDDVSEKVKCHYNKYIFSKSYKNNSVSPGQHITSIQLGIRSFAESSYKKQYFYYQLFVKRPYPIPSDIEHEFSLPLQRVSLMFQNQCNVTRMQFI